MKSKTYIAMIALVCLCTAYEGASAQEINIQNYCEDMARASRAGNDYIARCIATLEVQRKYQKQAEENAETKRKNQQEFTRIKGRTEWLLAIFGLQEEGKKAKTPEEREAIAKRSESLFANDCQGMASQKDCGQFKDEFSSQIGR